jgi:hypothetical protein
MYRTSQVRGSLLDSRGSYSGDVLLDLRIAELRGPQGSDDEAIADVSITFGARIPADGDYMLSYPWQNRQCQHRLRISHQAATVAILS